MHLHSTTWLYYEGRGVPRNLKRAVELFEAAAAQGYAPAQYHLAILYDEGRGVPQNSDCAVELYEAAAAQGYAPAQFKLGMCYNEAIALQKLSSKTLESRGACMVGTTVQLARPCPRQPDGARSRCKC